MVVKEKAVCNKCGLTYTNEDSIALIKKWVAEGYAPCPGLSCPGQFVLKEIEEIKSVEAPAVQEEVDQATKDLAAFLKLHDIEVDYQEADWKDNRGMVEFALQLSKKHPGWIMYYFRGDTWGIDSNYVFFTSKEVEGEVVEKIGNFIVNLGAELPEEKR